MSAPPSEAHRLARPPAQRRAAHAPAGRPDAGAGGPATVSFAALATMLGLTAGGGSAASYTFTLTGTGALAVGARGSGAYRTAPDLAMRMVFDEFCLSGVALPGGIEERVVGGAAYVRSALVAAGSGWARVPLDGTVTGLGDLDRLLAEARGADPPRRLRQLIAAGCLAKVGSESVRGVRTTRYAGAITRSHGLPPAGTVPGGQAGIARIGLDVWVDRRGRARRFVALAPTGDGDIRMALTFTGRSSAEITVPEVTAPQVTAPGGPRAG